LGKNVQLPEAIISAAAFLKSSSSVICKRGLPGRGQKPNFFTELLDPFLITLALVTRPIIIITIHLKYPPSRVTRLGEFSPIGRLFFLILADAFISPFQHTNNAH
jgi:hypothetical protein